MSENLPNGWPRPTFLNVEDDGTLCIKWIIKDDNLRISFWWDPKDGAMSLRTPRNGVQEIDETSTAATTLAKWLTEVK